LPFEDLKVESAQVEDPNRWPVVYIYQDTAYKKFQLLATVPFAIIDIDGNGVSQTIQLLPEIGVNHPKSVGPLLSSPAVKILYPKEYSRAMSRDWRSGGHRVDTKTSPKHLRNLQKTEQFQLHRATTDIAFHNRFLSSLIAIHNQRQRLPHSRLTRRIASISWGQIWSC